MPLYDSLQDINPVTEKLETKPSKSRKGVSNSGP